MMLSGNAEIAGTTTRLWWRLTRGIASFLAAVTLVDRWRMVLFTRSQHGEAVSAYAMAFCATVEGCLLFEGVAALHKVVIVAIVEVFTAAAEMQEILWVGRRRHGDFGEKWEQSSD